MFKVRLLLALLSVGATCFGLILDFAEPTHAHGDLRGTLIYTADAFDSDGDGSITSADNDAMLKSNIGNGQSGKHDFIVYGSAESAAYPRMSKDGLRILCHAYIDTNNDRFIRHDSDSPFLAVLNTDGSDMVLLTPPGEYAAFAANFSPNERMIAFSRADTDDNGDGLVNTADIAHLAIKQLGQVNPQNPTASQLEIGNAPQNLTGDEFSVREPTFLTNDLILFTGINSATRQTTAYMFDLPNRRLTSLAPSGLPPGSETRNPAGSPDGSRVAVEIVAMDEHFVSIYDRVTNTWTRQSPTGLIATDPTWSVDTLGMVVSDGSTWQILVASGTGLQTIVDVSTQISSTTFSPGGEAIAYLVHPNEDANILLAVATVDGGYNALITPESNSVVDFAWIPLGIE